MSRKSFVDAIDSITLSLVYHVCYSDSETSVLLCKLSSPRPKDGKGDATKAKVEMHTWKVRRTDPAAEIELCLTAPAGKKFMFSARFSICCDSMVQQSCSGTVGRAPALAR